MLSKTSHVFAYRHLIVIKNHNKVAVIVTGAVIERLICKTACKRTVAYYGNNLAFFTFYLLCSEIRQYLIETVSKTGGHLASNLGVVELTVALHRSIPLM